MKLVDTVCPHCGAHLKVDMRNKQAVCEHCGATILIDDEVQHVQYDNAEEAGYRFEKGRQRAQAEMAGTAHVNSESVKQNTPKKKRKTWLWVLGWICIFPLPLTILLLRKKEMKPALKYGIIAVAWIVYLLIGLSCGTGNSNKNTTELSSTSSVAESAQVETQNTTASEGTTKTNNPEITDKNLIDVFVERFNEISDTQLVLKEEFTPSDKESGHYRVEFRLNAYKDAIGKSFEYGDAIVDIVYRKPAWGDGLIRIYMDGATLDQCKEMLSKAGPIMDETATNEDIQKAIEYISKNKEANGYSFANLGLLLLGSDIKGYELMLKMGND